MATVWLLCRKKTLDFSFFSRFYLPTIAVLEEKKNAISGNMKHNTNRKWLFGSTAISPEPISRCCLMYFGMLFVLKMTIKIFVFEFSIILPSITFFLCLALFKKQRACFLPCKHIIPLNPTRQKTPCCFTVSDYIIPGIITHPLHSYIKLRQIFNSKVNIRHRIKITSVFAEIIPS